MSWTTFDSCAPNKINTLWVFSEEIKKKTLQIWNLKRNSAKMALMEKYVV